MERLAPIGTAIFKRLFFYFSNIYSDTKNKNFVFTKNYSDICKYWLGGLKPLKHKSKIEKEQLGPHIQAVKKTTLIRSARIEKNSKGDDFNITFRPGKGFFEDYKRFYDNFPQMALPFKEASERRFYEQPMSLVSHFTRTF